MPEIQTLNAGGMLADTNALKIRTGANPSEHLIVGLTNLGSDPVTIVIKGYDPDAEPDLLVPGGHIVLDAEFWSSETRVRLALGAAIWLKADIGGVVQWNLQDDVVTA